MDREFERFLGGPNQALSKRIHVTITPAHAIRLNRNMYHQMGKPAAVFLNYSRASDIIVLQPTSPRLAGAFPLVQDNGDGWRINAAPFCGHFGISIDMTLKFIGPELKQDGLYLKLTETVSVTTHKRRKK